MRFQLQPPASKRPVSSHTSRRVGGSTAGTYRPAIFLDRDGVINRLIYHKDVGIIDSPFTVRQFEIFPRVARAIRLFNSLRIPVIVVSNQPGIAKGHFNAATLHSFDRKMHSVLSSAGAHLDAVYYCLHHPQAVLPELRKRCGCRKPGIGMLQRAVGEFAVSLPDSFMIGDGITDIEAGSRAGCKTVFIGNWKCECCKFIRPPGLRPTFMASDLWEAAQLVVGKLRREVRKSWLETTTHVPPG
ncbi:MAG: HAD family hydrolase [Acidobacteria bacterium]|nr:HAD family hydrolase [Acidobacteriota bacterium]